MNIELDSYKKNIEKKNYTCNEFQSEFQKNSLGFFDKERSFLKDKNTFRIIAIGDSFTQGIGVLKHEKNYLQLLEEQLNQNPGKGKTFECLNLGIAGFDPVLEIKIFNEHGIKYNPDIVIMLINGSDIDDILRKGGMDRFEKAEENKRIRKKLYFRELLFKNSRIIRLIFINLLHMDSTLLMPKEKNLILKGSPIFEMVILLQKFSAECKNKNITPIFFILSNYYHNELFDLHKRLKSLSYHSIFWNLLSEKNLKKIQWEKDRHLKHKGYKQVAEMIYTYLKQNMLIPENPA